MGLAADIAAVIDAGSSLTLGTDLFAGRGLSDTPDTQVAFVVYGSGPPDLAMTATLGSAVAERPHFQVLSRAATYATAETNAKAAWDALQNYKGTQGGTTFLYITCPQSPFYLKLDDQNRVILAFNAEAVIQS